MKQIKFRGKRIDNGEWVYGDYLATDYIAPSEGEGYIMNHKDKSGEDMMEVTSIEIDPKTVGQFTGLTDRNGVEIYDGDKVKKTWGVGYKSKYYASYHPDSKHPAREVIGVVEWDNECRGYKILSNHTDMEFITEFEVIGNIHEDKQ